MVTIAEISFDDVKKIWETKLWPGRQLIETHSAMLHLTGHSMANFSFPVHCLGIFEDGSLVGVNTGHLCADGSFRSRGLWVEPEFRGKGYAVQLLKKTISLEPAATFCWSFPRKTSWSSYSKAGFKLTSDWKASETSEANAFCST